MREDDVTVTSRHHPGSVAEQSHLGAESSDYFKLNETYRKQKEIVAATVYNNYTDHRKLRL